MIVDGPKMAMLRKRRGLTVNGLCERAGINRQTVWRMERSGDRGGCSPTTLDLVARALGVDPNDLLPDEAPPEIACPACGATIRARMADL